MENVFGKYILTDYPGIGRKFIIQLALRPSGVSNKEPEIIQIQQASLILVHKLIKITAPPEFLSQRNAPREDSIPVINEMQGVLLDWSPHIHLHVQKIHVFQQVTYF